MPEMATFLCADTDPRHEGLVRSIVEAREGSAGFGDDGRLHASFHDARAAIEAAVALQVALIDAVQSPRPRCGIHAGEAARSLGAAHRAAGIAGAAHPGQILLSLAAAEAVHGRLRHGFALRDLGEVRLRDLSSERLVQLVVPGLPAQFPPPRSLDDVPNNLPEALLSFVGRAREIADIGAMLSQGRLVTLVGMGGVGKTRLAVHVAAESIERYPDGVWLVELGAVQEARRVLQTVASVLGAREDGDRDLASSVWRHAHGRRMLVILDNCEHLLDGAAEAARTLLGAQGVSVLATSREPLRLREEAPYFVPGLAVPRDAQARDAIGHYYSVRLFVDRARAASREFELSAGNASAIAALCNRLDGIPLAIELAAARLRAMRLPDIAASLRDRFHVLTGGDPAPLPRECTLWVLVDWSHGLLPEEERTLFRRLGAFAGGWTLDAALDVCSGDGVERDRVPALLAQLHAHSLVAADRGLQRYRMLETVREYAAQWLAQSGEQEAIRARHLAHFVRVTGAGRRALSGPLQGEWLARLDAERENLLAAHEHAGRHEDHAVAGLKLVNATKLYWTNRGLLHLGLRLVLEALRRSGAQADTPDRAQGLFNAGQLLYLMGRHGEARQCLEASLRIARGLGDAYVATVLQPLGMAALGEGDLERARSSFMEAVEAARKGGDGRSIAGALNALAMFHRVDGHPGHAAPLYEAVVRIARESGDAEVEAVGLLNFAMTQIDRGRVVEARQALESAIRAAIAVRSMPASQSALDVCAALAALQGDARRAARFLGAAEGQAARSGVQRDAADAMFLEPKIARAWAALGEAQFRAAEDEGRRCDVFQALREARSWMQGLARTASAMASR